MQIITLLSVAYKEGELRQSISETRLRRKSEPFTYSMSIY